MLGGLLFLLHLPLPLLLLEPLLLLDLFQPLLFL